jgi:hypothetical protein
MVSAIRKTLKLDTALRCLWSGFQESGCSWGTARSQFSTKTLAGLIRCCAISIRPIRAHQLCLPLDGNLAEFWRAPDRLGPPAGVRGAVIYAGPWTPDVVGLMPGGTVLQDASLRVLGLRLMLRQIGILMLPFWLEGGPVGMWERLMLELSIINFFALEEAVYDGNSRGNTPSLIAEWAVPPPHKGVATLQASRSSLSPHCEKWRADIRNKVCAHMDMDVPASMLDAANWPMANADFHAEVERLCKIIGNAARLDVRTQYLIGPAISCGNMLQTAGPSAPRWRDT